MDAFNHNPIGNVEFDEDFFIEIQNVKLLQEMGIQTWIGSRSLKSIGVINLFMIEPIVDCDVVNQEDLANLQHYIIENGDKGSSVVTRKRRRFVLDKKTCWDLVVEAQHIINVEIFYNIEENTNETSFYEEDDHDHQDF